MGAQWLPSSGRKRRQLRHSPPHWLVMFKSLISLQELVWPFGNGAGGLRGIE
jgi:hypothetical protein